MIPIGSSARMRVKTLESPPCHPISKKTIWPTSRRSYIKTRRAVIRQYELQGRHGQRNGAVQILSLPALHFQICDIQPGPWHQHCSNAKSQPSTYHVSLTLYRRSRFPRLVVITICLNTSLVVVITTFPNTKRLRLR